MSSDQTTKCPQIKLLQLLRSKYFGSSDQSTMGNSNQSSNAYSTACQTYLAVLCSISSKTDCSSPFFGSFGCRSPPSLLRERRVHEQDEPETNLQQFTVGLKDHKQLTEHIRALSSNYSSSSAANHKAFQLKAAIQMLRWEFTNCSDCMILYCTVYSYCTLIKPMPI